MYNVITILVHNFPMKNGCVCSVTWLTPLSAETRSPKFLYHDDLAVMNISCSFWNSLIISNVVVLALMQARGLGSGQWRHYLGGSTVFSPDISKAIRLGLMLLRRTLLSFSFDWGRVVDLELFCTWCRIGFRELAGDKIEWLPYLLDSFVVRHRS